MVVVLLVSKYLRLQIYTLFSNKQTKKIEMCEINICEKFRCEKFRNKYRVMFGVFIS